MIPARLLLGSQDDTIDTVGATLGASILRVRVGHTLGTPKQLGENAPYGP